MTDSVNHSANHAADRESQLQQITVLTQQLALALQACHWRISAAESCTGGWIAKACTDIAGSSAWFDRGFVTYSNQAKTDMLGVAAATLKACGAVSEEVAAEMAQGALARSQAQLTVAVSGIAGPGGGSADKPIGRVCFAWASAVGIVTATYHFAGDRDAVRRQSVLCALQGLLRQLAV